MNITTVEKPIHAYRYFMAEAEGQDGTHHKAAVARKLKKIGRRHQRRAVKQELRKILLEVASC